MTRTEENYLEHTPFMENIQKQNYEKAGISYGLKRNQNNRD